MTITLKISGMHCQGCVQSLTKALAAVAGVTAAKVSLPEASATIEGQDLDQAALVKAVEAAGFEVA